MSRSREETARHNPNCICCARGPAAMDAHIDQAIRDHGFALVTVADGSPPFAYSVGLTKTHGLPEFVVVGCFGPETMGALAACVGALAAASPEKLCGTGPSILEALTCTGSDGLPVKFAIGWKPVPRSKIVGSDATASMAMTAHKYGAVGFQVRQLFVPDANGKLPWEPGCDPDWVAESGQVDLGE